VLLLWALGGIVSGTNSIVDRGTDDGCGKIDPYRSVAERTGIFVGTGEGENAEERLPLS
jgi:hypothetical protein